MRVIQSSFVDFKDIDESSDDLTSLNSLFNF